MSIWPGRPLLSVALIGVVFGLAQSQVWGFGSVGVLGPLVTSVMAAGLLVMVERRSSNPLVEFGLLRRYPNYRAASVSQLVGGVVEMGLGLLFPLLLILNLGMPPGIAGLALVPTTLPMVAVAPLAGRWYDRVGGRVPLAAGFGTLAAAGIALGVGVHTNSYWGILPGLLLFGVGLALDLTVNDPVSRATPPAPCRGQASGVSDTARAVPRGVGDLRPPLPGLPRGLRADPRDRHRRQPSGRPDRLTSEFVLSCPHPSGSCACLALGRVTCP